jgi:hypothetical protein
MIIFRLIRRITITTVKTASLNNININKPHDCGDGIEIEEALSYIVSLPLSDHTSSILSHLMLHRQAIQRC